MCRNVTTGNAAAANGAKDVAEVTVIGSPLRDGRAHIAYCNNYSTILRKDRPFPPEDAGDPGDDER
jgi:hypothetical protein